jgi:hypothetical protein
LTRPIHLNDVYHVEPTEVTVYTYAWSNAYVSGEETTGTNPTWYTPIDPVRAISTESPLGDGSTLVRSELFMHMAWWQLGSASLGEHGQMSSLAGHAAGEVYPVGAGGFPDPRSQAEAQTTADFSALAQTSTIAANTEGFGVLSTGGFVTSQGIRGPAKYGVGTPELRVGLYVSHVAFTGMLTADYSTRWAYHLRALWRI